jgi:hypothetical protein
MAHQLGTNNTDTAAARPAVPAVVGGPRYFEDENLPGTPGTVVPASIMNMLVTEVNAVVTEVGGLSLDKDDDTQMAESVRNVRGIVSGTGDTTSTGTLDNCVLIASTSSSRARSANAAVIASVGGDINAVASAQIGVTGAGVTVNTGNCVMLASNITSARNSSDLTGGGANCIAGGDQSDPDAGGEYWTWQIQSVTGVGRFFGGTVTASADFAEWFPRVEPGPEWPFGAVLTRRGRSVQLATVGDRAVGVVSTAPALLGNEKHCLSEKNKPTRNNSERVALTGQVPVLVDHLVEPDHYLVAGPRPGVATSVGMLRPPSGRSIECMEILEPFDAERGYGVALCLVG